PLCLTSPLRDLFVDHRLTKAVFGEDGFATVRARRDHLPAAPRLLDLLSGDEVNDGFHFLIESLGAALNGPRVLTPSINHESQRPIRRNLLPAVLARDDLAVVVEQKLLVLAAVLLPSR